MKISTLFVFVGLLLVWCFGCTEQQRAKQWGGETTIYLEPGYKLVDPTWKDDNLWLCVRKMRPEDTAETYIYYEESSWGMMEGKITLIESKN